MCKVTDRDIKKYLFHDGINKRIAITRKGEVFSNGHYIGTRKEFEKEIQDKRKLDKRFYIECFMENELF